VTVLADVVAVDTKKHIVTLRGPKGNRVDLNVLAPARLKNIKMGRPGRGGLHRSGRGQG